MPSPILQEPNPVLTTPTSVSIPVSQDGELQEMRGSILALRKPYPGAPILYSSGMPGGFYFGARQAEGSDAVSKPPVNVAATSPIKSKSVPDVVEGLQCEKGWYISPFDGKKRMAADNPTFLEQKRAEQN